MGRSERVTYSRPYILAQVTYSRLLCARARAALLPARYSCPLAFSTRLLLLLVRYSCPGGARYPFVAKYEHARYPFVAKYEHARYPYVAKYEHPPGTGTTRGATPGYPCVARARTRPCARARYCP